MRAEAKAVCGVSLDALLLPASFDERKSLISARRGWKPWPAFWLFLSGLYFFYLFITFLSLSWSSKRWRQRMNPSQRRANHFQPCTLRSTLTITGRTRTDKIRTTINISLTSGESGTPSRLLLTIYIHYSTDAELQHLFRSHEIWIIWTLLISLDSRTYWTYSLLPHLTRSVVVESNCAFSLRHVGTGVWSLTSRIRGTWWPTQTRVQFDQSATQEPRWITKCRNRLWLWSRRTCHQAPRVGNDSLRSDWSVASTTNYFRGSGSWD